MDSKNDCHNFVLLFYKIIQIMIEILYAISAGILGIFAGAQIAEGVLFVPYWKSLKPTEFFELHKTFGPKIYQFFAPLTILATIIPLVTVGYAFTEGIDVTKAEGLLYAELMGICTLLFFSTYFLYFKKANQSFADETVAHEDLAAELKKWGNWHWARIYLEIGALVFALIALMKS